MPAIDRLLTRTVTIERATEPADDYDQTPGVPATSTTMGELQQTETGEALEGAAQHTTWLLFLPPDAELAGADAVVVDGDRYQLDGDPWIVHNPRLGRADHLEVKLRRAA